MRRKHGCNILILDIETMYATVHTWSLWAKFISPDNIIEPVTTLCWAAMWDHDRSTMFGRIEDPDGLDRLYQLIDEADAIVGYNSNGFDMKHLMKDFILAWYHPPAGWMDIDLYTTVRGRFKFQSNKLDYVCKQLGIGGKTKHSGMQLWRDVKAGCPKAWKKMEQYNRRDVKMTKALYHKILPWIKTHPNVAMWITDPANPTCNKCGSTDLRNKGPAHRTQTRSYKRYKCNGCGSPLRARYSETPKNPNVLARSG